MSCVNVSVKSTEKEKISSDSSLTGTSWNLINISGEDVTGKGVILHIQKNSLGGNAAVNQYFGNYTIKQDKISVSQIGRNEMAGEKSLMNLENRYIGILQNVKKIEEFCAHRSIVTFGGFGLDFKGKNGSEYASCSYFWMVFYFFFECQMRCVNPLDIVLHFIGL